MVDQVLSEFKGKAVNKLFFDLLAFSAIVFILSGCAMEYKPPQQWVIQQDSNKPARYAYAYPPVPPVDEPRPYQVFGKWYQPLASAKGFKQRGIASWYGDDFHGKRTSNGEYYDMHGISAAHKTLPLGTYVRVWNLENRKMLDVRINDRGPFVPGRIIDLSVGAAKRLGVYGPGTASVEIVALGDPQSDAPKSKVKYIPKDYTKGKFTIQIGAFSDPVTAKKLVAELEPVYRHAYMAPLQKSNETLYRVMVGRCSSIEKAGEYENLMKQKGFRDAFIIAE